MIKGMLGLDLGNSTTKVSISYLNDKKEYQVKSLCIGNSSSGVPTIAYYDEQADKWLYGDEAMKNANTSKKPIINVRDILMRSNENDYYTGHHFENDTCGYEFDVNSYKAHQVVEGFIKYVLEEKVNDALNGRDFCDSFDIEKRITLTYPAYAPDEYKYFYKEIVEKLGYEVRRLLPEPIAASINTLKYCQDNRIDYALVLDIGGDTSDIALVDTSQYALDIIQVESLYVSGNNFDKALYDYVLAEVEDKIQGEELAHFQRYCLRKSCEESKQFLSKTNRAFIEYEGYVQMIETVTREKFESLISNQVNKIIDFVLEQINSTAKKIGQLIMVGGGSAIPLIQRRIKDVLEQEGIELYIPSDPINAVANGAAIQTLDLINVSNITTKYYVTDANNGIGHVVAVPIVSINEKLPLKKVISFKTQNPGQTKVSIMVLETTKKPRMLGREHYWELYECKEILGRDQMLYIKNPNYYSTIKIDLCVSIDSNGIAKIIATTPDGDSLERKFSLGKE